MEIAQSVRPTFRAALIWLLALAAPAFGQQGAEASCALPDYESSVAPGEPVEISVGLMLTNLGQISDIDQTVSLDAFLTLQWVDQRLAGTVGCHYDESTVWTPGIQLFNSADIQTRQPAQLTVDGDGAVTSTVRVNAAVVSPANIAAFPFDRRDIVLRLGNLDYDADEMTLRISEPWTGRLPEMAVPDWVIGEPTATITMLSLPSIGRTIAAFEFQIPAVRQANYYLYKFVFPLCLIVMMSWAVFWVDPSNLSPQLSLSGTSMLTVIAYQFTMNELLPRVGYLTSMDMLVLSSSLLVFLALVEALVSGRLADNGYVEKAKKLDQVSRWLFPSTYLVILAVFLIH